MPRVRKEPLVLLVQKVSPVFKVHLEPEVFRVSQAPLENRERWDLRAFEV